MQTKPSWGAKGEKGIAGKKERCLEVENQRISVGQGSQTPRTP